MNAIYLIIIGLAIGGIGWLILKSLNSIECHDDKIVNKVQTESFSFNNLNATITEFQDKRYKLDSIYYKSEWPIEIVYHYNGVKYEELYKRPKVNFNNISPILEIKTFDESFIQDIQTFYSSKNFDLYCCQSKGNSSNIKIYNVSIKSITKNIKTEQYSVIATFNYYLDE